MIHWEHLKSCRCQLWIWRTIFLSKGIWIVHIFRHLFVCFQTSTRWENFIKIVGVNCGFDGRKYPFYWVRFASPVKRHLRPSNPQLTPPTLQIQYCYSLILLRFKASDHPLVIFELLPSYNSASCIFIENNWIKFVFSFENHILCSIYYF
jgi:hypothetical protein